MEDEMRNDFNSTTDIAYTDNLNATKIQNIPPAHAEQLAKFLCYQVLGMPISFVGILGNIICICVWTRKRMQWGACSTSYYLVALACSDLIYLLIINLGGLMPFWLQPKDNHFVYIFHMHKFEEIRASIVTPLIDVTSNISVFAVMAFTVERYVAITYPIKGLVLCTPKRAGWILLAGCIAVVILLVPNTLEYLPTMKETGYAKSIAYSIGYNWGIMVLFFAVAPLVTLIIFNTLLIRSVLLSSKKQQVMAPACRTKLRDQERKGYTVLTVTIITVVIVFFLCHTPNAVALVTYTFQRQMNPTLADSENTKWQIVFAACNLLIILNSSLNFLIYSMLSPTFRKTARRLSPWNVCSKPELQSKTTMSSTHRGKTTTTTDGSTRCSTRVHLLKDNSLLQPNPSSAVAV